MSVAKITHYKQKGCPACEGMKPELAKIKKSHKGLRIEVIDVDKAGISPDKMPEVPVTIVEGAGGKIKKVGGLSAQELECLLTGKCER